MVVAPHCVLLDIDMSIVTCESSLVLLPAQPTKLLQREVRKQVFHDLIFSADRKSPLDQRLGTIPLESQVLAVMLNSLHTYGLISLDISQRYSCRRRPTWPGKRRSVNSFSDISAHCFTITGSTCGSTQTTTPTLILQRSWSREWTRARFFPVSFRLRSGCGR